MMIVGPNLKCLGNYLYVKTFICENKSPANSDVNCEINTQLKTLKVRVAGWEEINQRIRMHICMTHKHRQ